MIVHSIIYYIYGSSIVPDSKYDTWASELVELQHRYPVESSKVKYYEMFKDWEGSTGYHLCTEHNVSNFKEKARSLLEYHRRNNLNESD